MRPHAWPFHSPQHDRVVLHSLLLTLGHASAQGKGDTSSRVRVSL